MADEKTITENGKTDYKNYKRKDFLHWDDYFMATAGLAAKRSKDPVTQVGACIVDKDRRIVAIGYNGLPRNCNDDEFPWCKMQDLQANGNVGPVNSYDCKKMYVVHAEANAILNRNTTCIKGTTLYTTLFPCNECAKLIIQSGISNILYMSDKYAYKPSYKASKRMLDAVGINYEQHIPTCGSITIDFNDDSIAEDPNNTL